MAGVPLKSQYGCCTEEQCQCWKVSQLMFSGNTVWRLEISSEDPKNNHPPEPEHQLETPQSRKNLTIYTSVDVAPKTLEMPINVWISCHNYTLMHFRSRFQVIFTLTPPLLIPTSLGLRLHGRCRLLIFILPSLILFLSQALHYKQTSQLMFRS